MILNSNLFEQVVGTCIEGMWIIDPNNKTTFVNQTMAQMLGYQQKEFIGKEIRDFTTPEEAEILNRKLADRKSGGSEYHELKLRKKSGNWIWVNAACGPLFNEKQEYIGAVGMLTEITERRKSELVSKAQRNVFEALVKGGSLEDALNELLNPIEEIVDGVIASILILTEDGKKLSRGIAPNLPDGFTEAITDAEIGPNAGSCGTAAYTKKLVIVSDIQNDPLWADYRELAAKYELKACWSSPIISHDGFVLGTFACYFKEVRTPTQFEVGMVKDFTSAAALSIEHKKLVNIEKRHNDEMNLLSDCRYVLTESIEYTEVLKKVPKLIVDQGWGDWSFISLMSDDGIYRANSTASRPELEETLKPFQHLEFDLSSKMGLSKAMKENKAFVQHMNDEDLARYVSQNGVAAPRPDQMQVLIKLKLRSYIAVPLYVRGKVIGGFLVASNTPGRYYTDKDLKLMMEIGRSCAMAIDNATLFRETKKSVKVREDFISIASHELRTPLTSLKMRIDLLSLMIERGKFPKEVMEKISPIVTEIQPDIQKFTMLVENLLDISKLGSDKFHLAMESCDLTKVIKDEVNRLKANFELQKTPLVIEIENHLKGSCDQIRIQQVITNLLTNALKFGNKKPVILRAYKDDHDLVISVQDHGIGIGEKDLERIFKPFERAVSEKHFGGLGLGLFITKQIVTSHGGNIRVESIAGEGTTFIVRFPFN